MVPIHRTVKGWSHWPTFQKQHRIQTTTRECPIIFCRHILGVHNKAMRIPVLAELGRFPVSLRLVGQVIVFWAHIATLTLIRTLKIYTLAWQSINPQTRTRGSASLKNILRGLGMTHVWDNHSTFSADRLEKKNLFWLSYQTDSASSGKRVKKEINQEWPSMLP